MGKTKNIHKKHTAAATKALSPRPLATRRFAANERGAD
jgi:hypothetical protein